MADTPIRVPLDEETLQRLRERAAAERRATADEASVILTRALAPRPKRRTDGETVAETVDR
jgi:plasmid stability protein